MTHMSVRPSFSYPASRIVRGPLRCGVTEPPYQANKPPLPCCNIQAYLLLFSCSPDTEISKTQY